MEGKYSEKRPIRESFSQDLRNQGYIDDSWFQRIPKRYVVSFMAFLGFCNIYALRVNLSIAMIAMLKEMNWDREKQGLVLTAFFWGYLLTQIPGGHFATKYGGKYIFGGGVLGTALLTILSPPASRVSPYFLLILRIIEGLLEGVTYPAMHSIWSKWAPPMEKSKLTTFAFSGSYIGTVIALPLSSVIATSIGWPWIFYIFGMMGVIWYIAWVLIVTESPASCSNISPQELEYIQSSIGPHSNKKDVKTPWRDILKSPPVYAIIVAHFVANWGFYTFLTELPTYLLDVLHFDLFTNGFVSSLPYLFMAFVVISGGFLADFLRSRGILSTTYVRKIFTSGAFVIQLIFILGTTFASSPTIVVVCLVLGVGFGGFAWSGFGVNHLDLSPRFAGVLMGMSNSIATFPGMFSPIITERMVIDRTAEQWQHVFMIMIALYAFGAVFYFVFGSGEEQDWNYIAPEYERQFDDHAVEAPKDAEE